MFVFLEIKIVALEMNIASRLNCLISGLMMSHWFDGLSQCCLLFSKCFSKEIGDPRGLLLLNICSKFRMEIVFVLEIFRKLFNELDCWAFKENVEIIGVLILVKEECILLYKSTFSLICELLENQVWVFVRIKAVKEVQQFDKTWFWERRWRGGGGGRRRRRRWWRMKPRWFVRCFS